MIKVTTPPALPAIPLQLLKEHLRIIGNDDDETLKLYLDAATQGFEAYANQSLILQTVQQSFDSFPVENFFLLERSPLHTFTAIQYYDVDGTIQTLNPSIYSVNNDTTPPAISLKKGASWPSVDENRLGAVICTYVAGYGVDAASVPSDIKQGLCLIVGDLFQGREDTIAQPGIVIARSFWGSNRFFHKFKSYYYSHASQSYKRDRSNRGNY
jgi:uncharacterized phiE125 gp8 family phage protein